MSKIWPMKGDAEVGLPPLPVERSICLSGADAVGEFDDFVCDAIVDEEFCMVEEGTMMRSSCCRRSRMKRGRSAMIRQYCENALAFQAPPPGEEDSEAEGKVGFLAEFFGFGGVGRCP